MIRWWPLQCENKLINTACVPHYWVSSEREKSRKLEFSLTHFTRSSSPTAATGISFVSNLIVSLFIWAKLLRISQSPVCRLVEAPNSDGDRFHLCDECHFKLNGIKNIIQTFAVLSFASVLVEWKRSQYRAHHSIWMRLSQHRPHHIYTFPRNDFI